MVCRHRVWNARCESFTPRGEKRDTDSTNPKKKMTPRHACFCRHHRVTPGNRKVANRKCKRGEPNKKRRSLLGRGSVAPTQMRSESRPLPRVHVFVPNHRNMYICRHRHSEVAILPEIPFPCTPRLLQNSDVALALRKGTHCVHSLCTGKDGV